MVKTRCIYKQPTALERTTSSSRFEPVRREIRLSYKIHTLIFLFCIIYILIDVNWEEAHQYLR